MRTMITVTIPVQSGNKGIVEGRLPTVVQGFVEARKPEAAYFTARGGKRTMIAVFDLARPSDIPVIAEPFFQQLDAEVEFMPVMNGEDLATGLGSIQKR